MDRPAVFGGGGLPCFFWRLTPRPNRIMIEFSALKNPSLQRTDMTQEQNASETMTDKVAVVISSLRRYLQADGGDIELIGVDEATGKVSVRLQGACKGCPGAAMTLKMGVERHLKEKVAGVTEVISVE